MCELLQYTHLEPSKHIAFVAGSKDDCIEVLTNPIDICHSSSSEAFHSRLHLVKSNHWRSLGYEKVSMI